MNSRSQMQPGAAREARTRRSTSRRRSSRQAQPSRSNREQRGAAGSSGEQQEWESQCTMAMLTNGNIPSLLSLPSKPRGPRANKGATRPVLCVTVRKPPPAPLGFSPPNSAHKATSLLAPSPSPLSPSLDDSFTVRPNLSPHRDFSCPLTDLNDPRASRRIDRPEHSTPAA